MITSLFAGFNSAVRSMQQSQFGMTVHGSNIANANDPTYTRRDVLPPSATQVGGPAVGRSRNAFVEDQYRAAHGLLGAAESQQDIMSKIEDVFGDPVEGGLRKAVDQLFDSFQALAENPTDGVARLQVLSGAQTFAQEIRSTYSQLSAAGETINEELGTRVEEVNSQLKQVYDLNRHIAELQRTHMDASTLQDQRDRAVDQLAKLTGASTITQPDGSVRVIIGSTPAVDGPTLLQLHLVPGDNGPVPNWQGYATPMYKGGGTLAGLVSVRDGELKTIQAEIDNLGKTVADQVNQVQRTGVPLNAPEPPAPLPTPPAIFVYNDAPGSIAVNPDLKPDDLAAAATVGGLPGNGDNARKLAALGDTGMLNSVIMQGDPQSPRVFYRNLVGWIGARAGDANQLHDIATAHVQVADRQRQSEWGVSLDEETARLTMEQKAFSAAARVISVMDQMLDDLINRTGSW
jgi:flagellar hook-associated protein 1